MTAPEYYSNCLFEALRAKFKDLRKVKLYVSWEPWTTRKFWGLHFWWETRGVEYDFKPTGPITWRNYWCHKGKIRSY